MKNRRSFVTAPCHGGNGIRGRVIQAGCCSGHGNLSASGPIIVPSDRNTVAEATAGKLRGFTRNGIHTFKIIPFGATTEESGRFCAPSKPKPRGRHSEFDVLRPNLSPGRANQLNQ